MGWWLARCCEGESWGIQSNHILLYFTTCHSTRMIELQYIITLIPPPPLLLHLCVRAVLVEEAFHLLSDMKGTMMIAGGLVSECHRSTSIHLHAAHPSTSCLSRIILQANQASDKIMWAHSFFRNLKGGWF